MKCLPRLLLWCGVSLPGGGSGGGSSSWNPFKRFSKDQAPVIVAELSALTSGLTSAATTSDDKQDGATSLPDTDSCDTSPESPNVRLYTECLAADDGSGNSEFTRVPLA